jgi:hypothetical protein
MNKLFRKVSVDTKIGFLSLVAGLMSLWVFASIFSSGGNETQEVKFGNIAITLKEAVALDEVAIVAFGTQKESMTASIATVQPSKLNVKCKLFKMLFIQKFNLE